MWQRNRWWGTQCLLQIQLYWWGQLSGAPHFWDQWESLEKGKFTLSGDKHGWGTFQETGHIRPLDLMVCTYDCWERWAISSLDGLGKWKSSWGMEDREWQTNLQKETSRELQVSSSNLDPWAGDIANNPGNYFQTYDGQHGESTVSIGLQRSKSCLTNLTAFY